MPVAANFSETLLCFYAVSGCGIIKKARKETVISMNPEIDKKREDFFKNCEYIAKAPACIFLEGNRFSRKAKVLPIPLYAYAGLERGNFKGFFYEEHNEDLERMIHNKQSIKNGLMKGITKGLRQPFFEIDEENIEKLQCRYKRPQEEEAILKSDKPISSVKKERQWIYQVYLDTEIKRKLTWKKVVQKDGKTAMEVFTGNKTEGKSAMGDVKETFDELLSKFKDYFKIKVWSEIPYAIGMNDGAAIASAVALILSAELAKKKESMEELTSTFQNLREKHPEEIILNNDFITVFNIALALDFFSNGAAVFASMLGCRKEQEIINYECLFYDDFKDSFKPYPKFKNVKEAMDHASNSMQGYFGKCFKFTANPLIGIPLFKWSFSRLSFKNRNGLALLIAGSDIVGYDEGDLEIPSNAEFKHYRISPVNFVILAEPSTIVLCEASPHKHIFGKDDELLLSFRPIYSSRKQGWGAKGANIIKPKEEPEPEKIPIPAEAIRVSDEGFLTNFKVDLLQDKNGKGMMTITRNNAEYRFKLTKHEIEICLTMAKVSKRDKRKKIPIFLKGYSNYKDFKAKVEYWGDFTKNSQIRTQIIPIKKKIRDKKLDPNFIENKPKVGYRLSTHPDNIKFKSYYKPER